MDDRVPPLNRVGCFAAMRCPGVTVPIPLVIRAIGIWVPAWRLWLGHDEPPDCNLRITSGCEDNPEARLPTALRVQLAQTTCAEAPPDDERQS
jgi:hypothetical protein